MAIILKDTPHDSEIITVTLYLKLFQYFQPTFMFNYNKVLINVCCQTRLCCLKMKPKCPKGCEAQEAQEGILSALWLKRCGCVNDSFIQS